MDSMNETGSLRDVELTNGTTLNPGPAYDDVKTGVIQWTVGKVFQTLGVFVFAGLAGKSCIMGVVRHACGNLDVMWPTTLLTKACNIAASDDTMLFVIPYGRDWRRVAHVADDP